MRFCKNSYDFLHPMNKQISERHKNITKLKRDNLEVAVGQANNNKNAAKNPNFALNLITHHTNMIMVDRCENFIALSS